MRRRLLILVLFIVCVCLCGFGCSKKNKKLEEKIDEIAEIYASRWTSTDYIYTITETNKEGIYRLELYIVYGNVISETYIYLINLNNGEDECIYSGYDY